MGFVDSNNIPLINDEQKLRLNLSPRAMLTMSEDMEFFEISNASTFINTVFNNFKEEAKASIASYQRQRTRELDDWCHRLNIKKNDIKTLIHKIVSEEANILKKDAQALLSKKGTSKIYCLNNSNMNHLTYHSEEDQFYPKVSTYLRAVIEEYCALPFIKREAIFKKDIYEIVEDACQHKKALTIEAPCRGKKESFIVYPYKIVPDPLHTQSYLICYSFKASENKSKKIITSFSMARLEKPKKAKESSFTLSKEEVETIESALSKRSPAYFLEKPEEIKIQLSEIGLNIYHRKLHSRPEIIHKDPQNNIFTFECTHFQIMNYFFSFGAEAKVISPDSLKEKFKNKYKAAYESYI